MLSHRKHEKISVQEAFEIYSSNLTDFALIVEFYKVNCDIFVIIVNRTNSDNFRQPIQITNSICDFSESIVTIMYRFQFGKLSVSAVPFSIIFNSVNPLNILLNIANLAIC